MEVSKSPLRCIFCCCKALTVLYVFCDPKLL
jgi:hypothetical protein